MADKNSVDRLNYLADIAALYYLEHMSQQDISKRIGISRSMVSYLLEEARAKGIVDIRISRPVERSNLLEHEFKKLFGLKDACIPISKSADEGEVLQAIGRSGAEVLNNIIKDGMVIGLGWGTGVRAVVQAIRPRLLPNANIVQMSGGIGSPSQSVDGAEMTRRVGEMLGAPYHYMNTPLIVGSSQVASALREDHVVKDVLAMATKVETAVIGIGTTRAEASTQLRAGCLTPDELKHLVSMGVVGDMLSNYFDIQGSRVYIPSIDPRIITISWTDITRISNIIAVASGKAKIASILGALRSGLVSVLVTDDVTAVEVLRLNQKQPQRVTFK